MQAKPKVEKTHTEAQANVHAEAEVKAAENQAKAEVKMEA